MKEINQIRITRIATILQSLPRDNVVNGQEGVTFVFAKKMHDFGKELMEIVLDEMEKKGD